MAARRAARSPEGAQISLVTGKNTGNPLLGILIPLLNPTAPIAFLAASLI
jgi:hypothetical protein